MAQNGIAGEPFGQHALEDVHLIDAFSGEAALAEEVLIDVGGRPGINIECRLSGIDAGEARPARRLNTDSHTGLEKAVPFDNCV